MSSTAIYTNPESAMIRMMKALIFQLKQITRANGYSCTIGDIKTEPPNEGEIKNFPAIALLRGQTDIENEDQSDQEWKKRIPFTALVYLRDQDPTWGRLKVLADLESRLGNYWMLPGEDGVETAREVTLDGDRPFGMFMNKPQVGFVFAFSVRLAQSISDPSVTS